MMTKRRMNERGTTLIEVVITVAVMAVGITSVTSGVISSKVASVSLQDGNDVHEHADEIAKKFSTLDFGIEDGVATPGQRLSILGLAMVGGEIVDEGEATSMLDDLQDAMTHDPDDGYGYYTPPTLPRLNNLIPIHATPSVRPPKPSLRQLRGAGPMIMRYAGSADRRHGRRRKSRAITTSDWEIEFTQDLNGDGAVAGDLETRPDVMALVIKYGDRVIKRVIRSQNPEE